MGAVFWDSSATLNLTRVSGFLNQSNGSAPVNGDVGREYAYNGSLSGAPGSRKYGISALGYGTVDPPDLFPGSLLCLSGGNPPDGPTGGLLSAGDNIATGNGGLTGKTMTKNSLVFTLSGLHALGAAAGL